MNLYCHKSFVRTVSLFVVIVLTGSFIVSAQAAETGILQAGSFGQRQVYAAQKEISAPTVGELDPTLNAAIETYPGYIRSSAIQADGKILLGGDFSRVNGNRRRGLVRLNADKSFDSGFNAVVNGIVYAITP